ncbi:MAG: hypothetical protein LBE08_08590 [Bifidobacteriaceae bacterium]|nr:hypothetical protein [Bifidobacteriaceae bacterium]
MLRPDVGDRGRGAVHRLGADGLLDLADQSAKKATRRFQAAAANSVSQMRVDNQGRVRLQHPDHKPTKRLRTIHERDDKKAERKRQGWRRR